jgi:patatin-like phospholipase/acyl hydrolase
VKCVLSIDGGGVRGIIPAVILAWLEKYTGKKVAELFDLTCGTSSGGILLMGLVKPDSFTAASMLDFFAGNESRSIFPQSLWRKMASLGGLLEPKYPSGEKVLQGVFGDVKLNEATVPIIVPAYDLIRRSPVFFKSHPPAGRYDTKSDIPLWKVAQATSAAPTYFKPVEVWVEGAKCLLVDGGVCANNPTMCAYAEARRLFGDEEEILLLSLGTGKKVEKGASRGNSWGYLFWTTHILSVTLTAPSEAVEYQMRAIYAGKGSSLRIQTELLYGSESLDDASTENVVALMTQAYMVLDARKSELREFAEKLLKK